ncbi:hypothetical protein BV20DRAFT_843727 [Pilatotrama ljubarskyi]|nr:hypothetical protein BV20DRAFT_843727 [Pilatotrama ljubarskyi]
MAMDCPSKLAATTFRFFLLHTCLIVHLDGLIQVVGHRPLDRAGLNLPVSGRTDHDTRRDAPYLPSDIEARKPECYWTGPEVAQPFR